MKGHESLPVAGVPLRRRVTLWAVVVACAIAGGAARPVAASPTNDDFANAAVLTPAGGSLVTDNTGATKETGEPDHAGDQGGASLWYSWTPSFSGTASIDTIGSTLTDGSGDPLDTLLGVYTGASVSALTGVASNDDVDAHGSVSRVCLAVNAGSTYVVAVDGYNGATGSITLNYGSRSDDSPCPTTPPAISGPGHPTPGDLLMAVPGVFVGAGATAWSWSRCTESLCEPIDGATGTTYVVQERDAGEAIQVEERLTAASSAAANISAPTSPVVLPTTTHPNGRLFWGTTLNPGGLVRIDSALPDGSSQQHLTTALGAQNWSAEPAVSPDGQLVAFVNFGNNRDIELMNADGSDVVDLGVSGTRPTWSPDGSRVAYSGADGIRVIDDQGEDYLVAAIPSTGVDAEPAWSPDGTKIAFSEWFPGPDAFDIMEVSADGRGPVTNLTNSPGASEEYPSWSPTADKIAFDRMPAGGVLSDSDLYVMDANGANQTLLYDGNSSHLARFGTAWSPDGSEILFSVDNTGSSDMYTIPAGGGSPTKVPGDGYANAFLSWGPLASYDLEITTAGSGSGTVTSSPAGISCGSTCSASFQDPTGVTLTPTAGGASTFAGWSGGGCSGTGSCVVPMLGDRNVTATFSPASSGGSGGGGGGGGAPNTKATVSVQSTPRNVGDVYAYAISLVNNGGGTNNTTLTVNLPAQTSYNGAVVDRGPGCTNAGTTVTCSLDFFPGGQTTTVIVGAKVNSPGTLVMTTSVNSSPGELNTTDGSVTSTLTVAGGTAPAPASAPQPAESAPQSFPTLTLSALKPILLHRVKPSIHLKLKASRATGLTLTLRDKRGHKLAVWRRHAAAGVDIYTLVLPARAKTPGHDTLEIKETGNNAGRTVGVSLKA